MPKQKLDPLFGSPARKFLFDLNDFDDKKKVQEPEEPPPPPPPTFSEAELEQARRSTHDKARKEALAEAEASREKRVADLLQSVTKNFATLFAAEDLRIRQYETESVALARAIFETVFPAFDQRHGFEEVERIVTQVLESQRQQPEITVEVHPDYVEDIRELVKKALRQGNIQAQCTINGNHSLGPSDCRMAWKQGGSIRDSQAIAREIGEHLQQMLADRPVLRDNVGKGHDAAQNNDVSVEPEGESR